MNQEKLYRFLVKKIGIIIAILLGQVLMAPHTFGQNCTLSIEGIITDHHNGMPLPYAHVYIERIQKGAISNDSGYYTIKDLCPGQYILKCSHIGCEVMMDTITLTKNLWHHFQPEHHAELLNAIEIQSERSSVHSNVVMARMEGKKLNSLKGLPLGEVIKNLPGVWSLNTGNTISKPIIHGLHSIRIIMVNNGVRQEGQSWGSEHAPEIDVNMASRIDVVKGSGALRYGPDAIGGLILVEPTLLKKYQKYGAEIGVNAASNGRLGNVYASTEGHLPFIKKLSWRLQGSLKGGGNVKTPHYFMSNTGVREYNFSASSAYFFGQNGVEVYYSQYNTILGIFKGSHIGNLTDLENAFNAPHPLDTSGFTYNITSPFQKIGHELFKSKIYFMTGSVGKLELNYSRQYNLRMEYDNHYNGDVAAQNQAELQMELTSHQGEIIWIHKESSVLFGQIGLQAAYQKNTYQGRFFIPNFLNKTWAAFLVQHWKKDKTEMEMGLRFDGVHRQVYLWEDKQVSHYHHFYNGFSGNLGSHIHLTSDLSLRVNVAASWRPPAVNELYSNGVHHGAASIEIGDRNLRAEKSYQLTTSLEYKNQKIDMGFSPYGNRMVDFIALKALKPPALTIQGAFPVFEHSSANVWMYGFDAYVGFVLPYGFNWYSQFALLRAKNTQSNQYLNWMPSDRMDHKLSYAWGKIGVFTQNKVLVGMQNVFYQSRFPIDGDYIDPPKAYNLVYAGLETSVVLGQQNINLSLQVQNLLNAKYREYLNRFRYYSDEIGRNFIVTIHYPLIFSKNHKK